MKYVLDANVGLKTVLPENDTAAAFALLADFQNKIHELIAPDIYLVECGHALTRSERKGIIQTPEAFEKMLLIAATRPQLFQHLPLMSRAMEISSTARHGLYDCIYLALAEREDCQLITADEKFANKFPSEVITLSSL